MSGIGKKPGIEQADSAAADLPAGPQTQKSAKLVPLRPRRNCPICGKKATQAVYPFCSVRCADIDLDRWLSGRYRVIGSADDDDAPPDLSPSAGRAPGEVPEDD